MKKPIVLHRLTIEEKVSIRVYARDRFSKERIVVEKGEEYNFYADPNQRWYDMGWCSSPEGYNNVLANLFGKRLNNVNCFCLCAAYNLSDTDAFAIGSTCTKPVDRSGQLSFFANDTWWAYLNNFGSIIVIVTRSK